jgi:hypothetical protein
MFDQPFHASANARVPGKGSNNNNNLFQTTPFFPHPKHPRRVALELKGFVIHHPRPPPFLLTTISFPTYPQRQCRFVTRQQQQGSACPSARQPTPGPLVEAAAATRSRNATMPCTQPSTLFPQHRLLTHVHPPTPSQPTLVTKSTARGP